VRIVRAADAETVAIKLAGNLAREVLTDVDVLRTVEQLQETFSWGVRQIARAIGRPQSVVSEWLAVARSKREREAVEKEQVALATATRLVRLRGEFSDVRDQILQRIDSGERVELRDVPRLKQLREPLDPTGTPTPSRRRGRGASEGAEDEEVSQGRRGALPPLELGVREQALVRNLGLVVRQVLSTLHSVRTARGPDRPLPEGTRQELERTTEEILAFLNQ
jgi:hypothetical protein